MKKGLTILAILYFAITSMAQSVVIGTQEWMSRNLDVEYYRDGTPIPQVTDPAAWAALTTGAWCYYNNDPTQDNRYGKLYNWYAVNDKAHGGIAPVGWHIPTDAEWNKLVKYIDPSADTTCNLCHQSPTAGSAMKERGTTHWKSPNSDATNSSGFTGLPGGSRNDEGSFSSVVSMGGWWGATERSWFRGLYSSFGTVGRYAGLKEEGYSVRCLRD